jgi:hypothetical protein
MPFPTDKQFDEGKIRWRDLPLGIYRIDKIRDIDDGEAIILNLANKEGKIFKDVWTPRKLKRQLGNFPETNYLRNNGLKIRESQYWDFNMLFLEEPNPLYA